MSNGQNLIPDPSFEEMRCDESGFSSSPYWFYLLDSKPDVHNECNVDPLARPSSRTVRKTPKFGESICRTKVFSTYDQGQLNFDNPIVKLKDTLQEGFIYFLSFYITLSGSESLAIEEYGAIFLDYMPDTNVALFDQPYFRKNFFRSFRGVMDDTLGWQKRSGGYSAKGGECAMALGCLTPREYVTSKKLRQEEYLESHYFIDGLSLIPYPEIPVDTILCQGQKLELQPKIPEGSEYEWGTGQKGGVLTITEPGDYFVMAYSEFDTIYVDSRVHLLPSRPTKPYRKVCGLDDVDVNLSLTHPGRIRWDDGISGSSRTFTEAGRYPFTVSATGCSLQDTLTIEWVPRPEPLPRSYEVCGRPEIWLHADTPVYDSITWHYSSYESFGKENEDSFKVDSSWTIWRYVFANECTFSEDISITFREDVRFEDIDTSFCKGEQLELSLDTSDVLFMSQSEWFFDTPGSFSVRYYSGCDTQLMEIDVVEIPNCDCKVFIPNAFTPNNDLVNDKFKLFSSCEITEQLFRVYNRWGQLLFESTENPSWDATRLGDLNEMEQLFFTWSGTVDNQGNKREFSESGFFKVIR